MARKQFPIVVEQVTMTAIADKGRCVGRDPEGRVVFVDNTAPGDIVDVTVWKKRKGVMMGSPLRFRHHSEQRVTPFCQHFDNCGGCQWQHLSYAAQLQQKEQIVHDAFQRIAKVPVGEFLPILPAPDTTYYRNKLEFGCANRRWLTTDEIASVVSNEKDVIGFHKAGAYDKLIEIDHCWLQPSPSNEIRLGLRELAREQGMPFFDMRERTGQLRQLLIRTTTRGETMVLIAFFKNEHEQIDAFLQAVVARFPAITTLIYCINDKVNEFLMDLDMTVYHGPGYIEENLQHLRFRIGPKSFFQTNTQQAVRLFDTALSFADLQGHENVYDLYTGIGSIGLYAANRCRQVVGIEEIAAAIEDAKVNAAINNITNARFYAGDVKDVLTAEFAETHGKPDILITDPPRAGMHPAVINFLQSLAPPRIIYVSCNPATQARDVSLLQAQYKVSKVRPVDMFPHTSHIETVALLEHY